MSENSATLVSLLNSPMPNGSLFLPPWTPWPLWAMNAAEANGLALLDPAVGGDNGDTGIEAMDAEWARPEDDDNVASDGEDADEAKMFDRRSLVTLLRAGSGGGAARDVLLGGGVTNVNKKHINK